MSDLNIAQTELAGQSSCNGDGPYAHLLDGPDHLPEPNVSIDFRNDLLSVGVVLQGETYIVRADRKILTVDEFGGTDYGLGTAARFSTAGIRRFLAGEQIAGHALLARLEKFFQRFLILPEETPLLLATWSLATYVYPIYDLFPVSRAALARKALWEVDDARHPFAAGV